MYYGFGGKILFVDLNTQSIHTEPLNIEEQKKFLGFISYNRPGTETRINIKASELKEVIADSRVKISYIERPVEAVVSPFETELFKIIEMARI